MGVVDDDFAFVAASVLRAARLQCATCRAVVDVNDQMANGRDGLATHLILTYEAIIKHVLDRKAQFAVALDDSVTGCRIAQLAIHALESGTRHSY